MPSRLRTSIPREKVIVDLATPSPEAGVLTSFPTLPSRRVEDEKKYGSCEILTKGYLRCIVRRYDHLVSTSVLECALTIRLTRRVQRTQDHSGGISASLGPRMKKNTVGEGKEPHVFIAIEPDKKKSLSRCRRLSARWRRWRAAARPYA